MTRLYVTRMIVPVLMLGLGPAAAWAEPGREAPATLAVAGIVYQQAVFGDDSPKTNHAIGPTLGVLFRGPRSGRTALTFEAMLQPRPAENPHYPESFAPFHLMAGAQIGRRTYTRLSGGITSVGGVAPIVGLAIGAERPFGATWLAGAEFVVRAGGVVGAAGAFAGAQFFLGSRH